MTLRASDDVSDLRQVARCLLHGGDAFHLRHLERFIISDAAPLDDCLLDTHLLGQFAQLLAATMNDTDANAYLVKQGEFFAKRNQMIPILSDLP